MASIFTRVRQGDLPGQILYQDDQVFVILSIAPHNPGHCLVIPVEEVADLESLVDSAYHRLMDVVKQVMQTIKVVYKPSKVALIVSGADLPDHCHVHVLPQYEATDIDSSHAKSTHQEVLKIEADKIQEYLKEHPIV